MMMLNIQYLERSQLQARGWLVEELLEEDRPPLRRMGERICQRKGGELYFLLQYGY